MYALRPFWALLVLFLVSAYSVALETPTPEVLQPITVEEITGNVSTNIIAATEILFNENVSSSKKFHVLVSTTVKELGKVICLPPQGKSCDCQIEDPGAFSCNFYPTATGVYRINMESQARMAYGNVTIELINGRAPILKQEVREETISLGTMLFALSFAVIVVLAYVAYFVYKLMMRKRDALNALYDQRRKVEDDMKVLRYRFLKREIDANTYNAVLRQKEQELAGVNEKIVKMLKSKQKSLNAEGKGEQS
ncbi:MAG: hypothetical protein V1835_00835 [Candidatus Micrarchaeota archaeon]